MKQKNSVNYNWVIKIVILAFVISIMFSFISETVIPNLNIVVGIILAITFILIGVIFDMIGVAVASAKEAPFHAMAANKIKGASLAIKLKKNADKVSSFCNDVVGDICGIVSGSAGAVISIKLASITGFNSLLITLFTVGLISSLTIGGKALEKGFAINKSNDILYKFAKVLSIFYRK